MNKAMLLVDIPKRCSGCEFRSSYVFNRNTFCTPLSNKFYSTKLCSISGVRKDCPLQPTTELLDALAVFANTAYFFKGDTLKKYNKLIKALGGINE